MRVLPEGPVTQRDDADRRNPEAGLHTGPVRLVCWKPPSVAGRGACRYSTRLRLGGARPARNRTRQCGRICDPAYLHGRVTSRPRSQRDPPRSPAANDHAGRAPRPEPARASSTSPETRSHRPRRDNRTETEEVRTIRRQSANSALPGPGPFGLAGAHRRTQEPTGCCLPLQALPAQKCRIPHLWFQA